MLIPRGRVFGEHMSPYVRKAPAPQNRPRPSAFTLASVQVSLSEDAVRGAARSLSRIDPYRSPSRHARQVDRLLRARTALAEARLTLAGLVDDQDPNRPDAT